MSQIGRGIEIAFTCSETGALAHHPTGEAHHGQRHHHRRIAGTGPGPGRHPGRAGLAGGHRRPPTPTDLDQAAAELARSTAGRRAGDVTDAAHRRALVEAAVARGPLELVVNNASTLGPLPMPALAALRPRRAGARSSRSTWWRRWPSSSWPCRRWPARRRGRQHHLRRRGRGLRGLGRLRRLQGRPRAARPGAGRRAPRRRRSTGSTPATCARPCTRTPSPARTSRIGHRPPSSVPGLLALILGDYPRGRYQAHDVAEVTP